MPIYDGGPVDQKIVGRSGRESTAYGDAGSTGLGSSVGRAQRMLNNRDEQIAQQLARAGGMNPAASASASAPAPAPAPARYYSGGAADGDLNRQFQEQLAAKQQQQQALGAQVQQELGTQIPVYDPSTSRRNQVQAPIDDRSPMEIKADALRKKKMAIEDAERAAYRKRMGIVSNTNSFNWD